MGKTAVLFGALLLAGATTDLAHKGVSEAAVVHERSAVYAVAASFLLVAWSVAILAARIPSLALGGGLAAGGALGNLFSLGFRPGVPNPIVLEEIAFNLADLFVLSGFVLTALATLVFALRNRDRLHEPWRLR